MILVLSLDGGSGWRAVCGAGLGVGRPGFVVTPVAGSEEACLQRQKIQELEESKNDDKRLKSSLYRMENNAAVNMGCHITTVSEQTKLQVNQLP